MTYFQPTTSTTLAFSTGSWSSAYHYITAGPDGGGIWHFTRNDQAGGNLTLGCYYNPTNGLLTTTESWNSGDPTYLSASTTPGTSGQLSTTAGSDVYGYDSNSTLLFHFKMVEGGSPAGPSVTSHSLTLTDTNIPSHAEVITSDTIVGSDFTFLNVGGTFTPTNFSLTAKSNGTGYNYDYYQSVTGSYRVTIDSKSVTNFFYNNSWTSSVTSGSSGRSTNATRILNVLATIPSNWTIGSGSDLNGNPNPLTTVFGYNRRLMQHTISATLDGVAGNIYINFVINDKVINGVSEIVATFYETRTIGTDSSFQNNSVNYIIGAQQTMTYTQTLLGDTTTYYVSDWVYSDEIEGDNYTPPVSTPSNGGGKPDRYPLIMTNLFNRNRSVYSIGMTHKDTWDLFE